MYSVSNVQQCAVLDYPDFTTIRPVRMIGTRLYLLSHSFHVMFVLAPLLLLEVPFYLRRFQLLSAQFFFEVCLHLWFVTLIIFVFFSAEQLASLYCLCFTWTAFWIESFICMLRPYTGWKLSIDTYWDEDEIGDSDLEQKQILKFYKFLQKWLLQPMVEYGGGPTRIKS